MHIIFDSEFQFNCLLVFDTTMSLSLCIYDCVLFLAEHWKIWILARFYGSLYAIMYLDVWLWKHTFRGFTCNSLHGKEVWYSMHMLSPTLSLSCRCNLISRMLINFNKLPLLVLMSLCFVRLHYFFFSSAIFYFVGIA